MAPTIQFSKTMTAAAALSYSPLLIDPVRPVVVVVTTPGEEAATEAALAGIRKHFYVLCLTSQEKVIEFAMKCWSPLDGSRLAAILISESVGIKDGTGLIKALRTMGEAASTPVLVVGRDNSDLGVDLWLEAGAQGYLLKLDDLESFASLIERGVTYWSRAA